MHSHLGLGAYKHVTHWVSVEEVEVQHRVDVGTYHLVHVQVGKEDRQHCRPA
jgi:hypothetical protein